MNKIIGLSLSAFYKIIKDKDINNLLLLVKKLDLDINGIEITFFPMYNNRIKNENLNFLNQMDYLSCHINPFFDIKQQMKPFINIDFYNYICHSNYDIYLYKKTISNLLVENLEKEHTFCYNNFISFCYNNFICCDISHLLGIGEKELYKFISLNKNKIFEFHISNYSEGKFHTTFHDKKNKLLEKIISYIKKEELINIPFIVEGSFNTINELKQELIYIKEVICKK